MTINSQDPAVLRMFIAKLQQRTGATARGERGLKAPFLPVIPSRFEMIIEMADEGKTGSYSWKGRRV